MAQTAETGAPQSLDTGAAAERLLGLLTDEDTDTQESSESRKPRKQQPAREAVEPDEEEEEGQEGEEGEADELEESEGGEEDEEQEEDESDDSEEEPEPELHDLVVDGKRVKVTLDELKKGYSRQQDYTQKTMQLATERKTLQSEQQVLRGEREAYGQRLQLLGELLQQGMGQEPNWEELRRSDPEGYAASWADWQRSRAQLAQLQVEQEMVAQAQYADAAAEAARIEADEQAKLVAAFPAWQDAKVATSERVKLREYAAGFGYTDDDLRQINDHRIVVILDKARKFDELMAKGVKLKQKKLARPAPDNAPAEPQVKPLKPGAKGKRRVITEAERARRRLAQTGRIDDAKAALMDFV